MTRVAIVTGGTRGIGKAICAAYVEAGYKVAAIYKGSDEAASQAREELGIATYKSDVSDFAACADVVEQIEKDLGPVDILVNNAGVTKDGFLHKMTPENWRLVLSTNLDSVFNMTRQVVEGMRKRKFGRIIVISSVNSEKGQAGQANYCAAKAGMIGFIKALGQEGARNNVTANAITPGYINTDMVAAIPEDVVAKHILPGIPAGRLGEPEEIARAAVFLASDDAGWITGSTIAVNGGQYMA